MRAGARLTLTLTLTLTPTPTLTLTLTLSLTLTRCVPELGFEEHAREWDDRDDLEGASAASSEERDAFVGF